MGSSNNTTLKRHNVTPKRHNLRETPQYDTYRLSKSIKSGGDFFSFFSRWWPPITFTLWDAFWDEHSQYLDVFIILQNLVGIYAVVVKMWQLKYLMHLAKKTFTPPKLGCWEFDSQNGEQYQRNPNSHILARKLVTWRTECQNLIMAFGSVRSKEQGKKVSYEVETCDMSHVRRDHPHGRSAT